MIRRIAELPTRIRAMGHDDLSMVSDIERRSYEFPWSHGVFRDCLLAYLPLDAVFVLPFVFINN
mgnify:CR=1 FL=1